MNGLALTLVVWAALGLELSLRRVLALGDGGIAPSFVACVVAWMAVFLPAKQARWWALGVGLVLDLLSPLPLSGGFAGHAAGPWALGLLAANEIVLALRPMVMRRSPVAFGFLAAVVGASAGLVVVCVMVLRGALFDDLAWSPAREAWVRIASSLYTGVVGLLLSFGLLPLADLIGIAPASPLISGRAARNMQ